MVLRREMSFGGGGGGIGRGSDTACSSVLEFTKKKVTDAPVAARTRRSKRPARRWFIPRVHRG